MWCCSRYAGLCGLDVKPPVLPHPNQPENSIHPGRGGGGGGLRTSWMGIISPGGI